MNMVFLIIGIIGILLLLTIASNQVKTHSVIRKLSIKNQSKETIEETLRRIESISQHGCGKDVHEQISLIIDTYRRNINDRT